MFESCIVGEYDHEGGFSRRWFPNARKRHECVECTRTIQPGEKYERGEGLTGDYWWQEATCMTCYLVRTSVCRGGWCSGELWDSVARYYCETVEDLLAMCPDSWLADRLVYLRSGEKYDGRGHSSTKTSED